MNINYYYRINTNVEKNARELGMVYPNEVKIFENNYNQGE